MATTKMVFHHMVLIFHSFKGFSDLEDFWAIRLPGRLPVPDDFQEVFQTTSRKSSDGVFSRFNQMVLIFHLDMYFVCSIEVFTDMGLIYMFFRSGSDFGRPMGSLLKYNALEDFQEGSLLTGSSSISSGV
ncbi:hypothetical protein DY000_02023510 [Brassica cretica]|uniref:Uncharacterized protein n=1 Tax=Brassica cretica TaxID=69181 RepID=A0ABQ7E7L1_BRACR|nr:hypothetical protein DY000_02023510 [Brassica cretica]